ncbi:MULTISPECIES: hypothetical protein [Bacillus cereus group]|uniref:hypothetical protein n=1 Tax=Bacillus cereus group TaxID=86661 RepID=UPI000BEB74DA|nr:MULTISPECIES: hypothetical protein [Bacillus cereus group]MCC6080407.1 hypothetical protein [Bacillus thuringiensis]PEB12994.1 hypothetical protein COM67_08605 [Bacillus thuringiensis]PEB57945.1 hypothetical protein COM79_12255 [Bacillus cereus]PEB85521.1 hypothetical protein COM94_20000 [Bacillus thuringiensis]PEV41562.1 hypothetical protein CN421_21725 [Bacillus thuringiensis]
MRHEKDLLKQWKTDLQAIQEEKRLKKKAKKKKKNRKYSIPGNTADFMDGKNTYRKDNGVWKQRNK